MQFLEKAPSVHWSSPQQQAALIHCRRPTTRRWGFRATRWGYFPWCSEPIENLVHEFDIGIARHFIPGSRILTLDASTESEEFQIATYGNLCFRIRPCLWREVPFNGIQLGDLVEISSIQAPRCEPAMATVEELIWSSTLNQITYRLSRQNKILPNHFLAQHLVPRRQLSLARRHSRIKLLSDSQI
jgi:hypothetical protein